MRVKYTKKRKIVNVSSKEDLTDLENDSEIVDLDSVNKNKENSNIVVESMNQEITPSSKKEIEEVLSSSEEEKILNKVDIESDSDSDAPEDISLKHSKLKAQETARKQIESVQFLKSKKKEKQRERFIRNKEQQEQKKERKKTLVPEKLDEKILELVNKEIKVSKIRNDLNFIDKLSKEKGHKILFKDEDDVEEEGDVPVVDDFEDEDDLTNVNKIEARCIRDVYKSGKHESVDAFLKMHFYGDRLNRETFKVNPCNRKQKNDTKRSKVIEKRHKRK